MTQGKLVWVGNVGTGFDQKMLAQVRRRLDPLVVPKTPFAANPKIPGEVTWVRPELVCMVKFSNWTPDARLRAPVFLGLRLDVDPKDVSREECRSRARRGEARARRIAAGARAGGRGQAGGDDGRGQRPVS